MKKLLLTAAACAFIAGPAFADHHMKDGEHHGKKMGHMMEKLDTDGDGMVSKAEHAAHHEAKFMEIDTDGDGNLTEDEMKAHWDTKKEEWKKKKEEMGEDKMEHEGEMEAE